MIEQSLSFLTVHDVAHRESLLIYSVLSCWHVVQTQYSPQPQDVGTAAYTRSATSTENWDRQVVRSHLTCCLLRPADSPSRYLAHQYIPIPLVNRSQMWFSSKILLWAAILEVNSDNEVFKSRFRIFRVLFIQNNPRHCILLFLLPLDQVFVWR